MADKVLLTIKETAKATGISVATLYRMMDRRELTYCKFGKCRRIPISALLELVERFKVPAL
jgi:excisionase family DNA binding protein